MESDWRYNVAEQGWALSDVRLLARLLNPIPGFDWLASVERSGPKTCLFQTVIFDDGSMHQATVGSIATPRFPAGIPVEPD